MTFVTLKPDFEFDPADDALLCKELILQVRKTIGPFATPKRVVIATDLPKTRSGKVCTALFLHLLSAKPDWFDFLDHASYPQEDRIRRGRLARRSLDSR